MATLYGLDRAFYPYISDDGNTYQVAITNNDAVAGGFPAAVPPGTNPVYPRGWRMRIQYGQSSANGRTKTPVASATSTQWVAPSTFLKHSVSFVAEGCIGERRTNKT